MILQWWIPRDLRPGVIVRWVNSFRIDEEIIKTCQFGKFWGLKVANLASCIFKEMCNN